MIVNVRGTSGSGKSTLVRAVMARYMHCMKIEHPKRRQPVAYQLSKYKAEPFRSVKDLYVPGHYETTCGGCDTISRDLEADVKGGAMEYIYRLVRRGHEAGCHVLFEGLLISAEVNRLVQLHKDGYPVAVVHLDVPLEVCLESVNKRRRERDPVRFTPVNPKNTESKWKGSRQAMRRFEAAGVATISTSSRIEALAAVLHLLDLPVEVEL